MPELSQLFALDSFNAAPLLLFALLWVGTLVMAPRQDLVGQRMAYGLILAGTVMAYCANNLAVFWLGWTLSLVPVWRDARTARFTRVLLVAGALALGIGLILLARQEQLEVAFALIMLAVVQRKGLFPMQSWVLDTMERGDLLQTGLLFNMHLGAVAVARICLPLMPELSRSALMMLADLCLATAVLAAVAAVAERRPRRQLALLSISQASTILAGLEGVNQEAITGALLHWMVVSLATTALFGLLRMVEVRYPGDLGGAENLGLGQRYPRLAVFFVVAGLALVGLPGTLGFCSEDLLLQGALHTHPWIGLAIPISTALNAVSLFRLFSRLFLGSRQPTAGLIPDGLLRERLPIVAILVALVFFGLFPQFAIDLRANAAQALQRVESPGGLD